MGIVNITPSSVKLEYNGKTLTIQGEAYLRGHGSPDFVAYSDSIIRWDPPDSQIVIDATTKREILELLKREMQKRNMTVEIE
jgi:hypothetical protein